MTAELVARFGVRAWTQLPRTASCRNQNPRPAPLFFLCRRIYRLQPYARPPSRPSNRPQTWKMDRSINHHLQNPVTDRGKAGRALAERFHRSMPIDKPNSDRKELPFSPLLPNRAEKTQGGPIDPKASFERLHSGP